MVSTIVTARRKAATPQKGSCQIQKTTTHSPVSEILRLQLGCPPRIHPTPGWLSLTSHSPDTLMMRTWMRGPEIGATSTMMTTIILTKEIITKVLMMTVNMVTEVEMTRI